MQSVSEADGIAGMKYFISRLEKAGLSRLRTWAKRVARCVLGTCDKQSLMVSVQAWGDWFARLRARGADTLSFIGRGSQSLALLDDVDDARDVQPRINPTEGITSPTTGDISLGSDRIR